MVRAWSGTFFTSFAIRVGFTYFTQLNHFYSNLEGNFMRFSTILQVSALAPFLAIPAAYAQPTDPLEPISELPAVTVRSESVRSFKSNVVQIGTFRDASPLDVPQSSNVITREVLNAQMATGLFDALRNTAGVTRSQLSGSTYDNIAIRGVLVENRGNYRLNGSLPVINLIDIPLENKERVEVLKGASSLYYGFVPPSGIVNLVTKRAGNAPVSTLALSANQHGSVNAHIDVGRRFGGEQQFGTRVNLAGGSEDIGINNFSGDRALASIALDWHATSALTFKLDVEHYRKNVSEQAAILAPAAVDGVITLPPVPDNRLNLAGEWQKYDADATNLLLRADYALSDNWAWLVEVGEAQTGRDRVFSRFQNYDLVTGQGTLRIVSFTRDQEWTNNNYRTELFGRVPGERITHELSLGYTFNERNQNGRTFPGISIAQNLYNPVNIAPQSPAGAASPAFPGTIQDRGWYLFDRILIGEAWQAMLGARSSDYESTATDYRYIADEVTPTFALLYKPRAHLSLYGSYLEALEESDTAGSDFANAGEVLPPALSRQKEIGVKIEIATGTLLQAAYFDIERAATAEDSANRLTLNGLAQYKGLELATGGEVTQQLSLLASALVMTAEQRNADHAATFGKVPDNTPERTGSVFAEYRLRRVPGLAVSGGAYYIGKRPVNNENQAFIEGYTTLSIGVRHTTPVAGKDAVFQAVLDNVTDKDYWSTAGNNLLGTGAPRTLKITAKVDF